MDQVAPSPSSLALSTSRRGIHRYLLGQKSISKAELWEGLVRKDLQSCFVREFTSSSVPWTSLNGIYCSPRELFVRFGSLHPTPELWSDFCKQRVPPGLRGWQIHPVIAVPEGNSWARVNGNKFSLIFPPKLSEQAAPYAPLSWKYKISDGLTVGW